MQIHCPRCGATVQGTDINIATQMAACRPCGEVFPLPASPVDAKLETMVPATAPAAILHKPTDLVWSETGELDTWGVAIPMKRAAAIGLAFFALIWDGFLVVWYGLAFTALATGKAGSPMILMLVFPLLHVGAGVFITYQALCGLFNTAYVGFDRESFRFERRPIPMKGKVSEPTAGISGFEPLEQISRSRRSAGVSTWDVNLLTTDGRAVRVAFGFSDYGHAVYAAARLTQQLADIRKPELPYRS